MQDGQPAVRGGAMEGDECYRFSTIRNFICQTGAPPVRVFQRALTAQHLYRDDFGGKPFRHPAATGYTAGYQPSSAALRPLTLSRLLPAVLRLAEAQEIDIMKMDCEGCEHSSLGTASLNDLARIRFIVGEYHYFSRF